MSDEIELRPVGEADLAIIENLAQTPGRRRVRLVRLPATR
jgi:hypothetical protein